MTAWLLRALGISRDITAQIDKVEWRWARPEWLILGLILIGPVAWWIVRRHSRNLGHVSPGARRALSACRIGVVAVLVLVVGEPYVRVQETIAQKPIVAVIVDESGSMKLPAGPFDSANIGGIVEVAGLATPTKPGEPAVADAVVRKRLTAMSREELLSAVLAAQQPMFKKIAEKFDVRMYRVAQRVRQVDLDVSKVTPVEPSQQEQTSLGVAIQQAIDDAAGRRLSGIILMTDGRSTSGPEPLAIAKRLAEGSDEHASAPIFTVPIGSDEPQPDIAVVDALAPSQVAAGDTVAVLVTLESTGFEGRSVKVNLMEGTKPLASADVTLHAGKRQQAQLTFQARDSGARMLSVEIAKQPEEKVGENNVQPLSIRVDTDKFRVLYLENIPRWDFRFLDHALRRDRGVEAKFVMESQMLADGVKGADLAKIAGLPKSAAEWANFHVVVLGDISPALLTASMQAELAAAVENEGVGLIIQAGTQNMPQNFMRGALGRLMPVKFDDEAAGAASGPAGIEAPPFAPFKMNVTAAGSMHPAFSLYGNTTRDRQVWSGMPPVFWVAASGEAKPGATVLAEVETLSGKRPLIAEQWVGKGRVLLLGTDETFRWRRNIGDQLFYRFWGQVVRHVAKRQERGGGASWMEIQPQQIEPGSTATIELYAIGGSGKPLESPQVQITMSDGTASEAVTLDRGAQPGFYRGIWTAVRSGHYTAQFTDEMKKTVAATVRVSESGRERAEPTVDRAALGTLADVSRGAMIELADLPGLPAKLVAQATTEIPKPLEQDIWDTWLTLVVLVAFYCTDVGIRRVLGLI